MQTNRFGRRLKLPSTIAIRHQIRKLMLEDSIEAQTAATIGTIAPRLEERPLVGKSSPL